jgi:NADH dehydrogenase
MKVFVAGGSGYVGGHIVAALLATGHQVTVMSRNASGAKLPPGVEAVDGDLADHATYAASLAGHDAVVHAVGLIRNRRMQGQTFARVVADGTRALVEASKDAGVGRIVYISANGVEPDGTAYQRTKAAAEDAVRDSGIPYTILRPSLIFAEDDDFVNQMRRLLRLGAVPYFGRGDYRFAPVHADDVAMAVARSLVEERAKDRVFHVCGPESVTYKELLKEIKAASGSRGLVVYMPKWMVRVAAFLLGWLPFFPATNPSLTMLFAGNTCPEADWTQVLGIDPVPFREGIRRFLG